MITCVMVTGKERGFSNMPEIAVQCFLDQEYQDCELLILNHGAKNFSGRNVWDEKIKKDDHIHIGALRNLAFNMAAGDYLATWDDDDWHHPKRLAMQVRRAAPDTIVMFKNRIHVNLNTAEQGLRAFRDGALNTMLFPKNTKARFPNYAKASDFDFSKRFLKTVVMDNPAEYYIRNAHGSNINDVEDIMGKPLPITDSQKQLVSTVRGLYKRDNVKDK